MMSQEAQELSGLLQSLYNDLVFLASVRSNNKKDTTGSICMFLEIWR